MVVAGLVMWAGTLGGPVGPLWIRVTFPTFPSYIFDFLNISCWNDCFLPIASANFHSSVTGTLILSYLLSCFLTETISSPGKDHALYFSWSLTTLPVPFSGWFFLSLSFSW